MDLPAVQTQSSAITARGRTNIWGYLLAMACWGYLLMLAALVFYIRTSGDRSIPATLLLFSPRWIWLLPLVVLTPLSIAFRRWLLLVLGVTAIVAIFPLMGFCLGLNRFQHAVPGGLPIRVIAFNVHQNALTDPAVASFLARENPDVVGIEEAPPNLNPRLFPRGTWHFVRDGEQIIASRYPIISRTNVLGGAGTQCVLASTMGPIAVIILHLASPHYALRDSIIQTPDGSRELWINIATRTAQVASLKTIIADTPMPLIIAGDFNLAPDSGLFLGKFPGMIDAFEAVGWGFGWTYHNAWTLVRIDHVLSNSAFQPRRCVVGPYLGSPHRPIIADLTLLPTGARLQ